MTTKFHFPVLMLLTRGFLRRAGTISEMCSLGAIFYLEEGERSLEVMNLPWRHEVDEGAKVSSGVGPR